MFSHEPVKQKTYSLQHTYPEDLVEVNDTAIDKRNLNLLLFLFSAIVLPYFQNFGL